MEIKVLDVFNCSMSVEFELDEKKIEAVVYLDKDKKVGAISNGYVYEGDTTLASFSTNGEEHLNINYNDAARLTEVGQTVVDAVETLRSGTATINANF